MALYLPPAMPLTAAIKVSAVAEPVTLAESGRVTVTDLTPSTFSSAACTVEVQLPQVIPVTLRETVWASEAPVAVFVVSDAGWVASVVSVFCSDLQDAKASAIAARPQVMREVDFMEMI